MHGSTIRNEEIQAVHVLPGIGHKSRWHNDIPLWIEGDPRRGQLGLAAQAVLRVIADTCDPPDGDGNLIGAFGGAAFFANESGVSRRTYWRAIDGLTRLGFVVLLGRGGLLRSRSRGGITNAGNAYGIPGVRDGLNHRRSTREMVRIIEDADGRRVRLVTQPGDQASFWPTGDTTLVSGRHYPSVRMTLPQCQDGTLPSPIPSPIPPPVLENHGHGGGAARSQKRDGTKKPHFHVRIEDLKDTHRLVQLHCRANAAGWIGGSEDELLWFVAAAEHAQRVADKNPCGLFVATVRNKSQRVLWVTQADEEAARGRLNRWMDER